MKKNSGYIIGLLFILVILLIISIVNDRKNNENNLTNNGDETQGQIVVVEESGIDSTSFEPISKALAIKMIALYIEDKSSIMIRDREIDYGDSQTTDWFDKYFNVAIVDGWYQVNGDVIDPQMALTYEDLNRIAEYFGLDLSSEAISIGSKDMDDLIGYNEFIRLYSDLIADALNNNEYVIETVYIFATPAISTALNSWEVVTDKGIYNFEGLYLDEYVDQSLEVLVKGNDIIHINKVADDGPILKNAYITNVNDQGADIFISGVSRQLTLDSSLQLLEGEIVDVRIEDGSIQSMSYKEGELGGIVKRISSDTLIIEGYGPLRMSEDTKFYNTVNGLEGANISDVIVGYETARIVLEDEASVAAIIIDQEAEVENIRVAISTTSFNSLYHEDVLISSGDSYSIYINDSTEELIEGSVAVSSYTLEIGDRMTVVPGNNQMIVIDSISRGSSGNSFNPEYRGIIEIERVEEGYLLVNEVDFEAYLYSVVPSEMPGSYGFEALKVQAICARSYAYTQLLSNRYHDYGAHVDDSVACQVYNNISETSDSIAAVDETKGQMILYNGSVVVANFFSTSCGVTANAGNVWPNSVTKEFPTTSPSYLVYNFQGEGTEFSYNLSEEEDFIAFIDKDELVSYDQAYSWYRWETAMTKEQVEAVINQTINDCYEKEPKLIKTLDDNSIFRSRKIEDNEGIQGIGELIDLWVYSRGESGIITELVVEGSNGIYKIASEYYIRKIVAPMNYLTDGEDVVVVRQDGSSLSNASFMPSAFYYMIKTYNSEGKLLSVGFNGGGYGHGVGMSQNGVKAMVDLGYEYEEILTHYYAGVSIGGLKD